MRWHVFNLRCLGCVGWNMRFNLVLFVCFVMLCHPASFPVNGQYVNKRTCLDSVIDDKLNLKTHFLKSRIYLYILT